MNDEYAGQGGTYLLDPATGKRTLVARTMPAGTPAMTPAAVPVPSPTQAPELTPVVPQAEPEAQTEPTESTH